MNDQLKYTAILAAAFLLLFALAELLYHGLKVRVEFTRKLVHFGTGLLTLMFPVLLSSQWLVLLLCGSFMVLLLLSSRLHFLKSIHAIDRKSFGSLLYPVSVYVCYLAYEPKDYTYAYFYFPILLLAICDPLAALAGKKWPYGKYKAGSGTKTIMGSAVFFISAFLISAALLDAVNPFGPSAQTLLIALIPAAVTTLAEALSRNGFDNLSIPLSALLTLLFLV